MPLALALRDAPSAAEVGLRLSDELALGDPWFLTAIPLALALLLRGRAPVGRPHLVWPAGDPAPPSTTGAPTAVGARPPRSLRQRLAAGLPWLQALALVLFGLALARPLRTDVRTSELTEGVDILAVLDRSSSMLADDLERGRTRLAVAREVVGEFAERRMTDRVDAADSVGLIAFARFPDLVCPITLDADAFAAFLADVEPVEPRTFEDGTAIGVALAKAVSLLADSEAESRVAILLTDGENGDDTITPLEAADLAAERGVRVYTVFAGGAGRRGPFGSVLAPADTAELEQIAERTGGRFYRAEDRASLESVYAEIEELERTPRERVDEVEAYDLYPRLLGAGLGLYLLAWVGATTLGRRLP